MSLLAYHAKNSPNLQMCEHVTEGVRIGLRVQQQLEIHKRRYKW